MRGHACDYAPRSIFLSCPAYHDDAELRSRASEVPSNDNEQSNRGETRVAHESNTRDGAAASKSRGNSSIPLL